MSTNAKMFVTAKKETLLELMPKLINDINKWQRIKLDNYLTENGFDSRLSYIFRDKEHYNKKGIKSYSNGIQNCCTTDFKSFHINFTINDENRSLFITNESSNDYSDIYEGDKIIFSLGCWGMSNEIMMVISDSIKEFGNTYYTPNDCATEFIEL